jgi:hypothetical protein
MGHETSKLAGNGLLDPPSRKDVQYAFRLILGREVHNESAIDAHMAISSVAKLRTALLSSPEFRGKYQSMFPEVQDHPSLSMERSALVFIHLQKTGGTSLRSLLAANFPANRICPILEDKLHLLTVAELGRYDFFSGHFDQSALRLLPRRNINSVALFRDPHARLISLYRFLRSHPVGDEFAANSLVHLANEASPEEFFESPQARCHSAVFNHYLIALGASYAWFDRNQSRLVEKDYAAAMLAGKQRIRELTAVGITEQFDRSVRQICRTLRFPMPANLERLHGTDDFPDLDPRFRDVPAVETTPRLRAALEELTVYDRELYSCAIEEFEQRCAAA